MRELLAALIIGPEAAKQEPATRRVREKGHPHLGTEFVDRGKRNSSMATSKPKGILVSDIPQASCA